MSEAGFLVRSQAERVYMGNVGLSLARYRKQASWALKLCSLMQQRTRPWSISGSEASSPPVNLLEWPYRYLTFDLPVVSSVLVNIFWPKLKLSLQVYTVLTAKHFSSKQKTSAQLQTSHSLIRNARVDSSGSPYPKIQPPFPSFAC